MLVFELCCSKAGSALYEIVQRGRYCRRIAVVRHGGRCLNMEFKMLFCFFTLLFASLISFRFDVTLPMKRFIFRTRNTRCDRYRSAILLSVLALSACSAKREAVYRWQGMDESRTLTLRRDKTFTYEVDGGYFFRTDSGRYALRGDTLILNPDRAFSSIDSLVEMDERYAGRRYMEVMQPVISYDAQNRVSEIEYRGLIFPNVTVNDAVTLELDSTDASFRRLLIPDSLNVRTILIRVPEERTCRPEVTFRVVISPRDPPTKSFRIVLRSHDMRSHYLAGFRWLLRGDTVYATFVDDDCTPGTIRLAKTGAGDLP